MKTLTPTSSPLDLLKYRKKLTDAHRRYLIQAAKYGVGARESKAKEGHQDRNKMTGAETEPSPG